MQATLPPARSRALPFHQGLLPGLEAGAVMLLMMSVVAMASGGAPLEPLLRLVGASAHDPPLIKALTGLVVHLSISALLGGLFAHAVGKVGRVRQLGLGLGYAAVLWLLQWLVAGLVDAGGAADAPGRAGALLLGHLAYGLMLGAGVPTGGDIDEHRPS